MSEINCDCGYNYTQTGCPTCKHVPIDYTEEYEQALANMQREYDKRGERIKELEKACKEWSEVSQSNYQRAKAAEAKLAKAVEALQFWSEAVEPDIDKAIALMASTLAEIKGEQY